MSSRHREDKMCRLHATRRCPGLSIINANMNDSNSLEFGKREPTFSPLFAVPDGATFPYITTGAGWQTECFGKRIYYYDVVASTQDIARSLSLEGTPEGTLVIAETQTSGRGRKGREWVSHPGGGIYCSVILRPSVPPAQAAQIPLAAGVALARAIRAISGMEATIKWPNDIIIKDKKVAGIISEMRCEGDRVDFAVTGFGVNIGVPIPILDAGTGGIGTSLEAEADKSISRTALLRRIAEELEKAYFKFAAGGFGAIRGDWKDLTNTLGKKVRIRETGIEGIALDIDEAGSLVIRQDSGEKSRVSCGEISF